MLPTRDFTLQTLITANTIKCRFKFPREIQNMIITTLFKDLLLNFNYREAFVLAQIDRSILKMLYQLMYGPEQTNAYESLIKRISQTTALLEGLHDEYITTPNPDCLLTGQMLCIAPSLRYKAVMNIWDFYPEFDLMEITSITSSTQSFGEIHGNTALYDMIVKDGKEVSIKFHPIFILGLTDYTSCLISSPSTFTKTSSFKQFASILKSIYGKHTAVFWMVKPDTQKRNPFITSSDIFISL